MLLYTDEKYRHCIILVVFFIHYAAVCNILFYIGVKNHVYVTATHAAVSLKDFRLPLYNNDALLKK